MILNTTTQKTVGEGMDARWDFVEDVYLMPETVADARVLESLYTLCRDQLYEFTVRPGENPALILRLSVVKKP